MVCAWVTTKWVLTWFQEHLFIGLGPGMLCFHWNKPGKAKGGKEKLGAVMLFPKFFSSRFVFILLYPIARGKLLDAESDSKGSHILAFIKLWCELSHMAQKWNRETVKGFLQGSNFLSDCSRFIAILWCRHAQVLCWEVQYRNLNWTELISSVWQQSLWPYFEVGYISVVAQKFTSFLTAKWKGHFSLFYWCMRH